MQIVHRTTAELTPADFASVIDLCDLAFAEETGPYFTAIGEGDHLLVWDDTVLVSHLMWVPRWLMPAGQPTLRTAYIEMVATAHPYKNQGWATRLLESALPLLHQFDLAALSPATERLYLRLGWTYWRGPLSTRLLNGELRAEPDERVMIHRLAATPATLDPDVGLSIEWRAGEAW